jgi:Condensation domain
MSDERELSSGQWRLWFLEQFAPGNRFWHLTSGWRLRGRLDVGAMERAWERLVERHEVLRSRFVSEGGRPRVEVDGEARVWVEERDLRGAEEEEEARRQAAEEAGRPFDLARGPLLRVLLLRLGEEEWALQVTVHHIVSDGWSLGVMWGEVSERYGAEVEGREAREEELEVQYGDYARWQREWLEGEVMERQLGYWRERLRGVPEVLELPGDQVRPRQASYRAGWRRLEVPEEVAKGLRELSRRERVTVHDDAGGVRGGGGEVEGLVVLFVNMVVMRGELGGEPSFRELLGRVRRDTLGP